jgi:hypothetical protein
MLSVDERKAIINYRRQKSYDSLSEARAVAKHPIYQQRATPPKIRSSFLPFVRNETIG